MPLLSSPASGRVRRVAARQTNLRHVFPHQAVDRVGIHPTSRIERLAVAAQRSLLRKHLASFTRYNRDYGD